MIWMGLLCLMLAAMALAMFLINSRLFGRADAASTVGQLPPVSVLVPARNEASTIETTIKHILASQAVDIELLVLDDHSTDETASIVQRYAHQDERVRLIEGKQLTPGWCGKQYACQQLAEQAQHDELVFLDADVRLTPTAISRAVATRLRMGVELLSGFPRQLVGSFGEQLLIPLIDYILLCYLPFRRMRRTTEPASSAGCGQFFVTHRDAYSQAGGHAAIRSSLHDGLTLPRAFRSHGLRTDVFDASDIAQVRMYEGFVAAWRGLAKNAVEGVANAKLIVPVTVMLFGAHVLPPVLIVATASAPMNQIALLTAGLAMVFSYLPRVLVAARYDGGWWGALLHPVSILLFISIQWFAFTRHALGIRSTWRGRSYSMAPHPQA